MKWLGGVMLVLLSLTGNAQKTVFQNLTWEQAAELAQKENKIILVDAMREPATPTWNFVNSMWWPSVSIWLLRLGKSLLRNW